MYSSGNKTVDAVNQIHFSGNIVPVQWLKQITFDNGKPDVIAIMILADVMYWYRPTEIRDEATGNLIGFKKKFKADALQRNYKQMSETLGCTERQAKDASLRLERAGLFTRELRTVIDGNGRKIPNCLFILLTPENIENIKHITFVGGSDGRTSDMSRSDGGGSDGRTSEGLTVERQTNTEITNTKISKQDNNKNYNKKVPKVYPYEDIINLLNAKTGKNFKHTDSEIRKLIKGRLDDGYTFEDFSTVISWKVNEWLHNPKMVKYLRPSTLFAKSHFANYLNEGGANEINTGNSADKYDLE